MRRRKKLNRLLLHWHPETVVTRPRLRRLGISPSLQRRYEHSGWLRSIGVGAAVRYGREVEWPGAVHALQHQLCLSLHVGGPSSFALSNDPRDTGTVYLCARQGVRLPLWFTRNWGDRAHLAVSNFLPVDLGLTIWEQPGFPVRVAGPERAMLECARLVSDDRGFLVAARFMRNLTDVCPTLTQKLLESCGSIKAKRLFLFLARRTRRPWLCALYPKRLDLGSGPRRVVRGGELDKIYKITVPREFEA